MSDAFDEPGESLPELTLDDFPVCKWFLAVEPMIENPTDGSMLLLVPGGKFLAGDDKVEVLAALVEQHQRAVLGG